ncbi:MAG: cation diffusion facilitator family transporter [Clostridiales bacterium]|nr:cation diffusion facilitator family transporter [Clostridiales bacterium]
MIRFLIKKFVKDYKNTNDKSVRESYGVFSGVLGIICNLFLFGVKLAIGLIMNSIAITSDAFNNLSDTGSSMITILGAKLSNRVPDEEHPFGHGRFEYISSLIIAFIIILVGFELLKSSFDKILNPEKVEFSWILIVILSVSILVKVWMYFYNRYIGNAIGSKVNQAAAYDSLNDVVATSAVILTTIVGKFIDFPIDGIAGLIVSMLIMYTGYGVAKDTVNVLLGMSPSAETVDKINSQILECDFIEGVHDLKVHDYGPGRTIASVHVEMSDRISIVKAHTEIDKVEKRILNDLGIDIVIHVDPMPDGYTDPID